MKLKVCCIISNYPQDKYYNLFLDKHYYILLRLKLSERFIHMIKEFNVTQFISGINLGAEQCAVEALIELKKKYPSIMVECVLPYENQSSSWTELQRDKYFSIMEKIDKETMLQYHYTKDCMIKRDEYMVSKAKFIIKICDNDNNGVDDFFPKSVIAKKIIFNVDINSIGINTDIKLCR